MATGTVDLMGFAPAANPVTFTTPPTPPGGTPVAADFRWGEFYQKALSWTNTSVARFEGVEIDTDDAQAGPEETRWVFLPKTPEWFSHDADGNLLSDGKWIYTWDGENRLIAMETNATLPAALPPVRLEFVYDHMSRRCVKRVFDKGPDIGLMAGGDAIMEGSAAAVVQGDDEPAEPESVGGGVVMPIGWSLRSTVKFVWDGWNLSAELDGQDSVRRTCAWGLDLSGSEQGAGGVGGLVFQRLAKTNTTHHLFYDGNGNVTSLRGDAGEVSAAYEYGPFGETLTARGDADALASNAFGFSTKYADESGLYYYGYRYYNPGTGRWLNRDPIAERGGNNLFGFVANVPVATVDYLGLILIAIDGTGSRSSNPTNSYLGHVYQFYKDSRDPRKRFYHGPALSGSGVSGVVNDAYQYICDQVLRSPEESVDMIGYSRGGLAVTLIAKKLKDYPCICGQRDINFMGLYDAVDMYIPAGADVISDNVSFIAHARRDPGVGSRALWGNASTSGGKQYQEKFFWVTHAGAGGAPWTGDHPTKRVFDQDLFDQDNPGSGYRYESTITKEQDNANSIEVDKWMRGQAELRGVQIDGPRTQYYQFP